NANDQWINPSLFGSALMRTDQVVSETFPIPETATVPTIDAAMGADEWADSWQLSGNIFDNALDISTVSGWDDMRYTANLMWKGDNLFIYLTVMDDMINMGTDYNTDGVEIYFDANNSKGETYDGVDDIQLRFNVGESTTDEIDASLSGFIKDGIDYVVEETDLGWDLEVSFTLGDLQVAPGEEFGFDIQLNDADETTRGNNMVRWWSDDNNEWQNASLFGTANLVSGTAVKQEAPAVVSTFKLNQNYPNPFNPTTNITYSIAKMSPVTLTVYNLMGEQMATLVDEVKPAGEYTVTFDASSLTSGVYLYTLQADGKMFTNKMMLMK
ncbi:T9SS C-terminal target domain-containing protein, partial [candidate division KSB1 bacterium]